MARDPSVLRVLGRSSDPECPPEVDTSNQINYLKSEKPFVLVRFITECGHKLEAKVLTVATAIQFYHNFRKASANSISYDPYLISAACLYLAGKVEDNDYLRMRDIINVVHTTLHREKEPPTLDGNYYNMREAIVQAELFLLRMLKFHTTVRHPHKYLLHYLRSLRDWFSQDVWNKYPIARTSWSFLQDAYHDANLVSDTSPEELSIACIQLSLECYGVQVPLFPDSKGSTWFKVFSGHTSLDRIWDITARLMDVYNQETAHLSPIVESQIKP